MTLAVALLVRDGSQVAPRCLASVRPHIGHWTIAYSGQEDDVTAGIRELLDGIPGTLTLRPFKDATANRTAVLKDARGTADYILHIDDDHELVVETCGNCGHSRRSHQVEDAAPGRCWVGPSGLGPDNWPKEITGNQAPQMGGCDCQKFAAFGNLTADVYMVEEREGGIAWRMPRLLKGDREWRYAGGPAHEYLEHDANARQTLEGLHLIHHGDGVPAADKLGSALTALREQVAANPTDARSWFYLANTLRELGRHDEAIDAYRVRLALPGWDEENFYARYMLGCLLAEHRSYSEGARELLAAWEMRPGRIEPLRALANAGNAIADRAPLPDDALFVHPAMYGAPQ